MEYPIRINVDSTVLNTMDLCPERWRLEYYENWRPQRKALALERGILMHQMLEHFYRQRMPKEIDGKPTGGGGRNRPTDMPMLVEECIMIGRVAASNSAHIDSTELQEDIRVFKEYFQRWQYDGWEILQVERPFSKILFESEKLIIFYDGIIDLVVRDPKMGVCVVDNKTESRESTPFVLSNQFQGYEWASGGLPLIINKIGYQQTPKMENEGTGPERKKVDNRFRRLVHQSGEEAIREWREDAIRLIIESIGWRKQIEEGKRLRKNRTSCDKWSGCIFQKVCKEPADVREHKLTVSFFKDKPWDVFTRDGVERPDIHAEATAF